MIEQQVREQLDRLSIFGNIQTQTQFQEYFKALQYLGYTELLNTVDWLVLNHDRRGLPLPAEIIKTSRELSAKKNDAVEAAEREKKYHGSLTATQAYCAAFRLCWLISEESMRRYFWEKKLVVPVNMPDSEQIRIYNEARNEIEGYLKSNNIPYSKQGGTELIPEMASENYGF